MNNSNSKMQNGNTGSSVEKQETQNQPHQTQQSNPSLGVYVPKVSLLSNAGNQADIKKYYPLYKTDGILYWSRLLHTKLVKDLRKLYDLDDDDEKTNKSVTPIRFENNYQQQQDECELFKEYKAPGTVIVDLKEDYDINDGGLLQAGTYISISIFLNPYTYP